MNQKNKFKSLVQNKKGDLFSILSKKELVIGIIILAILLFGGVFYGNIKESLFQSNQKQIIEELKGNINSLIGALDSIKGSVLLLNQNVGELQKTKASEESVKQISTEVQNIKTNLELTNTNLNNANTRLTEIEESIKIIEPSYVQNVDIKDLRTYINILNFRLVINFFIALSISLFAVELIKFFGDFLSFGYSTKNYNLKSYFSFRKIRKETQIKFYQEHHHKHGPPKNQIQTN